jgi:hypothetical protein
MVAATEAGPQKLVYTQTEENTTVYSKRTESHTMTTS